MDLPSRRRKVPGVIARDLTTELEAALRRYPIVTIIGPRQAGKTTLAKAVVAKPYANLEAPDVRSFAQDDPRGFLAQYPDGAILDEVQRVPALMSYLQVDVGAVGRSGRWVLTGSHQPELRAALAQSLAGRTALLHLYPLSLGEWSQYGRHATLDELLIAGGYPRVHEVEIPAHRYYSDYIGTYLERDVRQILNVNDLATFQRFLGMFAGRHAQIMKYAGLGSDVGISEMTAKTWCSVLEASHVAFPLRPWFANIGKRLSKSPKWYGNDSGLMAYLVGCSSASLLATHPNRGHLFEGWVVGEVVKTLAHFGSPARVHFFSAPTHEVDVLVEANGHTLAVEIKSGMTVASDWFRGLDTLAAIPEIGVDTRMVVYGGDETQCRHGVEVCPWWLFALRLQEWLLAHDALPVLSGDRVELAGRLRELCARSSR